MFLFQLGECRHEKVSASSIGEYCPDCGEFIKNKWIITRCACCGLKQKSRAMRGKISADTRFCRNCGSQNFIQEEIESIDIVNIQYAVLLKEGQKINKRSFIQTWIDENTIQNLKLLPCF